MMFNDEDRSVRLVDAAGPGRRPHPPPCGRAIINRLADRDPNQNRKSGIGRRQSGAVRWLEGLDRRRTILSQVSVSFILEGSASSPPVTGGAALASVGVGNYPIFISLAGMFAGAYVQGRFFEGPSGRGRADVG